MADKNPFGGLGLGYLGSERQFITPLIDSEQKRQIKRGLLGAGFQAVGAEDFFNKAFGVKPPAQTNVPPETYTPTKDFSTGANYGFNALGLGINPNKINAGPTSQVEQPVRSVDDEVDEAWGNKKTSEFTPRNPSMDQMPQQFAQGPIAPPTSQYPALPQTGGLSKMLMSFFG